MYTLTLPPELVTRLWHLREHHGQGPIRRQVLRAVSEYLDQMEQQYGTAGNAAGREPAAAAAA